MATNTFHHIQANGWHANSNHHTKLRKISVNMSSEAIGVHRQVYGTLKFSPIGALTTQSLADTLQLPSKNYSSESLITSNETVLTLLRHGESMWNEKNLFTGCVDVPLTQKGIEEAIEAGKRISNIPVDVIYTSSLLRAQMTAAIAMTQHRCKKVPAVLHNESEQARTWSEIHSEEAREQSISVITSWQLNERMYGDLQGFNKQETAEKLGKELVHAWRRTYHSPPPNGESLEMCSQRAVAYFRDEIEPQLLSGKNLLVTAHANSLRSIIMYLDRLTAEEVINLEMLTGIPMLYVFEGGKFIRRGSPVAPTEAGVYAYTTSLAFYRQKLDQMPA
ncbi:uncharacterized protein A4U43_C03F17820 [Asparagus officinalis]|uniref:phosphoglycerate mutase (2,3-diphosphoglycerate-dependent) n=1 Tax=Asparagus officinalis TaxID=4686 RepID=A0A5P1FDT5_ASPOF|nr:uncharacterized protein LOC109833937 [Asparagus officinalis]XP_020257398.1 uncharacterized protein LOC109833937 [Asparagus officinalis]XP_020257399.1 uncharacterized protein LOC109833937 [Asparagus officinalis]ONK75527.1 uncharacterized protein A4U43_C03F17820 [Asparagus officinalis]